MNIGWRNNHFMNIHVFLPQCKVHSISRYHHKKQLKESCIANFFKEVGYEFDKEL